MNDWWIYENWTAEPGGKAIVHNGKCSFCNHGKGIHPHASDRNGKWLGPFSTKENAFIRASKLGRARVDYCSRCCGFH